MKAEINRGKHNNAHICIFNATYLSSCGGPENNIADMLQNIDIHKYYRCVAFQYVARDVVISRIRTGMLRSRVVFVKHDRARNIE